MLRKFIFCFFLLIGIFPVMVLASDNSLVKVGNNYYDTLEEAMVNASSWDVITLISDVELSDSLVIQKTINLNLNGNDIVAPEKVFIVQGGTLNISGAGTIKEENPNYGAIMVIGSDDSSDREYSVVNVEKDVTLEGWSGIFISHNNSKSYGVVVNLAGKINAVSDMDGSSGIGIYVNGNIQDNNNVPVVNIRDGAEIRSNGNGLYIAGYAIFNVGKAYISGIQSGIGMKSGVLNIDGATVACTGKDDTPTEGYNNGMKASGTTIQLESNSGYAGNMEIDINSGSFKSKNSHVIYEYIGKGSSSLVKDINISGGTFISDAKKDVFLLSNSFLNKHREFISGGRYSSNPSSFLQIGYKVANDDGLFSVVKNTLREVSGNGVAFKEQSDGFNKGMVVIIGLVLIVILIFINRKRILAVFVK